LARDRIIAAASGILAASLIFVSLALIDPLRSASDADLLAWWSADANLEAAVASMYARLAAVPFLLLLVAHARARFDTGSGSIWAGFASSAGVICAAMLALSGLTRGVTAEAVISGGDPVPGADTLRLVTELAYQAYGFGAIAALALVAVGFGIATLLSGSMSRWVGWIGIVAGALALVAAAMGLGALASPLLLLWLVIVSIALARNSRPRDAAMV
jgi:hypothetical protein